MDWKDTDEMIKWGRTPDSLEKCRTCQQLKPLREFRKPTEYKGNPYWQCKECHYKSVRKNKLAQYGMTSKEYDDLLLHQNGKCAICRKSPTSKKRLAVDHNHDTGEIRGLLCSSCNLMIGNAKNSPFVLERAINYLEDVECLIFD